MKKFIILLLSLIFSVPAFADGDIDVYLNGGKMAFEQPPIIRDDSTLVPLRAIFEALNMAVEWNGEEKRITAYGNAVEISLVIGSDKMTVNGKSVTLTTPAIIYNDFTMIPLRAVGEAAGAEVQWDGDTRTVYITTEKNVGLGDTEKMAREVLALVNNERAKYGLNPLKWDDTLAAFAELHCEDMIERNFMSHVNPDGEDPFDRLKYFGINYWTAGENIAAGQKTPAEAMDAWMNSETHRENILNPNFRSLGVHVRRGGSYGIYWVQEFALFK